MCALDGSVIKAGGYSGVKGGIATPERERGRAKKQGQEAVARMLRLL